MYTHPGHKLLFMGDEFGQTSEWNVNESLEWDLMNYEPHQGICKLVQGLNDLYRSTAPLFTYNFDPKGFDWIDHSDHENCVLSYIRKSDDDMLIVVCNFTPQTHQNYRVGIPSNSSWVEILNTDDKKYWGSGRKNPGLIMAQAIPSHGKEYSLELVLPPLACLILKQPSND